MAYRALRLICYASLDSAHSCFIISEDREQKVVVFEQCTWVVPSRFKT